MKELVENIEKQITTDKEVISVLPRNGIKAIKTLLKTISDMTEKYENLNEKLLKEIETRYTELTTVEENKEIPQLEQEILKYDVAEKNTDTRSSFEKMGLDRVVYNVNGYYKSNLERLNKEIIFSVKQFEKVGIKLTAEDFCISEYAKKYMEVLLQEAYEGDINSEAVKNIFEKIYWQCSEIVSHLYVNIRYIYDKYENQIDRFFNEKSQEILKSLSLTLEGVEEKKAELIKQKNQIEETDDKNILDKFYTGTLNINDYKEDNYKRIYTELTNEDVTKLSETEKKEIDENIEKLNTNLTEYAKYLEYKFLVEEVLQTRQELLKNAETNKDKKDKKVKKTQYELIKEEIKKLQSEIFKLNAKIEKPNKGFFERKKTEEKKDSIAILQRNNLVLDLKKTYMQLDEEVIKQKILQDLDETSSLYDVIKFASSYYGYMAKVMIKNNEDITDKEIGEKAEKIRKFVNFSNFTVINHVNISDTKELSIIIKDKYKLLGMQISKENFEEDSIEDLIRKVKIINNYNNIQKSKFSIKDLEYIMNVKQKGPNGPGPNGPNSPKTKENNGAEYKIGI